jgi:hypothetical protein
MPRLVLRHMAGGSTPVILYEFNSGKNGHALKKELKVEKKQFYLKQLII